MCRELMYGHHEGQSRMEKLVLCHVSYIIPSINSINMSTIFFKHRFYREKYVDTLIFDQKVIVIFHKLIEDLMPNLAFLERNRPFFTSFH